MDNALKKNQAIILVNPLGGICEFRDYARKEGLIVVSVYSIPKIVMQDRMGQNVDHLESMDDHSYFFDSVAELVAQLNSLPYEIVALIPSHECGVDIAAEIAQLMGLISNKPENMLAARNKYLMRQRVRDAGLRSPQFASVKTKNDIEHFISDNPFPLVIKTPLGGGTSNVYVCHDLEQTATNLQKIQESPDLFGHCSAFAVLESHLGGREIIVDGFVDQGKITIVGIWEYDKISTTYGNNLYYNIISSDIHDERYTTAINYTKDVVQAVGIEMGMFHCELKIENQQPTLVEIGARLPGWGIPELYRAASNFDPWQATTQCFIHGSLQNPLNVEYHKHMAMAICPTTDCGSVEKINGITEIQNLPSYERHLLKIKPGDWLNPTSELYDTPLEVCLANEDRQQLLKDMEAVHSLFSIQTMQELPLTANSI